jgi:hypothetical protein
MNYEKDIVIDGESLDLEWLHQPALMMRYTQNSARRRKELEEARQSLDVAKAEADKMIRTNPDKYGIEKMTETVVANAVLKEKGYQQAYTEYLEAKYESDMAQGAVNAFEHRKSALENLVRLYGQQYFSGPKLPLEINREWEKKEEQKEMNRKIKLGMVRKRKEANDDSN